MRLLAQQCLRQLSIASCEFPAYFASLRQWRGFSAESHQYNSIKVDTQGSAGIITLSRPKQLNALNAEVMKEVVGAATAFDRQDSEVRAIVITGQGPKSFAAGADIKEMSEKTYVQAYQGRLLERWEGLTAIRKPLIAAVNGYALGGGCELAMMCDIIVASDNASFGQPEVTLGVIPGMGGTQRLTRAIGKYKAMDIVLTGRRITAQEAEAMGLVSRVVPADDLLPTALQIATSIGGFSLPVIAKAKECVNKALETTLAEGIIFEKREFWSCFALSDQKEGMAAFVERRKPGFTDA